MSIETAPACALGLSHETLSALRDGLLPAEEREWLRAHSATCAACQGRLADFDLIAAQLRGQSVPVPDEGLWHGVQAAIVSPRRPALRLSNKLALPLPSKQLWGALGAAAAVLLIVASFARILGSQAARPTTTPAVTTTATAAPSPTVAPTATPTLALPYTFPTTWHIAAGLPAGITGFVFAPQAPQTGFACSGRPVGPSTASGTPELDVTHDGGATWQALRTGPLAGEQRCSVPFIDESDVQDLFVAVSVPITPSSSATTDELWRSRDGGATWSKLASPDPNYPISVDQLFVIGGRIVVDLFPVGEGNLPYYLLGSDDGGKTWTPLGQSLLTQKDTYGPVYEFGQVVDAGATLYASIDANCHGGCRELTPASGEAPPGEYRSTDGGTMWHAVSLPYSVRTFTRTPSGAYYGLALGNAPASNGATALYWSRDAGATWTALPTMAGLEGGYVDPSTLGDGGLTIAPDGTIIASAFHDRNQGTFAGLFYLRATDPAPAWRPLAPPGAENLGLQAVPTQTGIRLWGIQDSDALGEHLIYVDLP